MYLNKHVMTSLRTGEIDKFLKNGDAKKSIREQPLGKINLPTGKIVANDPCALYEKEPFARTVTAGEYPVMLYVMHINDDQRVAFAEIRFTEELPVDFEMALTKDDDPSLLNDDAFFGYGVDCGTGGFMDEVTCGEVEKIIDESEDYMFEELEDALEESYVNTYSAANVCLPESNHNVVAFSSGWGDGSYPTYWGFYKNGELCSLITDFMLISDEC
jgi:hypothetical protein